MTGQPARVVIIGGGYTGIWALRSIMRRARREVASGAIAVTMIAPKSYHSFHGWTAEALTGIISIGNRQSPLRRLLGGQKLLLADALRVDLTAQTVSVRHVSDGRMEDVPYDHLLLANGSYDNLESVPGLAAHGWTVKSAGGVLATRNQLLRLLETASSLPRGPERQAWLTIVLAGGGFAGVEFAAGIAEMLHALRRFYPALKEEKPRIVLVHAGATLLPVLRPRFGRLADYCTRQLEKWGVEVRLKTRLAQVTPDGAMLSDGTAIASRTVLSALGQRLMVLPGTEDLPRTPRGLLTTDETLHVRGRDNVWAGGDAAEVMHISGHPCPANALWAIKHGHWVGGNIAATVTGGRLKRFTYRGLGQAASLGIGRGAAELYGVQFTGWIGWFLRFFFFLYFQPSRRQAVRVFLDWLTLPFLGRYLTISDERRHEAEDVRQPAAE